MRRAPRRRDGGIGAAERLVEQGGQGRAEAAGEGAARLAGDVTHAAQAEPRGGGEHRLAGAEGGEGEAEDGVRLRSFRHHAATPGAGERCRAEGRVGDRAGDGEACPAQPRGEPAQKRLLAAEKMGAAGDVERDAIGRAGRGKRGDAEAPGGEGGKAGLVSLGLCRAAEQAGRGGERIGERRSGRDRHASGRRRHDTPRPLLRPEHERRAGEAGLAPDQPLGWQQGEGKGQVAPSHAQCLGLFH
ncbi:MAG: hypothetical protein MUC64_09865 [Rubritepida sp.]|nr:hypothetical protein [Rubritepida sp.]